MDDTDTDLRALVARMERLEADNAELRASNAELRVAANLPDCTPAATPPGGTAHGEPRPLGRRQMLRTGLVVGVAAAAGAVLSDASPAAAADGGALIMGQSNTSTNTTSYVVTGAGHGGMAIADNAGFAGTNAALVLDVDADQGHFATGLHVRSEANNAIHVISSSVASDNLSVNLEGLAGTGIKVDQGPGVGIDATSSNNVGIRAQSPQGLALQALTTSGKGLLVNAGGSAAADFYADTYQLRLVTFAGRAAPTTDSIQHSTGELVRDSNAELWLCVSTGVPGTWRKVGGPSTAGQLHVLPSPARVYDSRPFTSPNVGSKTPLAANVSRSVDLTANSSTVPADATAVMVNLLLVNLVAGNGNFTVWANGVAKPLANTMVFANTAAANRASTLAVTGVDSAALCQLNSSLKTDVIVDVVGYYR